MKRSGFTIVELVVVLVVLALVVFFCWRVGSWLVGGKSNPPRPMIVDAPSIPPPPPVIHADEMKPVIGAQAPTLKGPLDFTGLRGVLVGKWQMETHTLHFTAGKTAFLSRFGSTEKVAKYEFVNGVLKFTTENDGMRRAAVTLKPKTKEGTPNEYVYGVEFLSDGEVSFRLDQSGDGFDWFQLAGRWKRISLPDNLEALRHSSGPIADAKRQVQNIEQKLAKVESVLDEALAEREELAAKLRSVGVNSPSDLKNNIRGRRLAESAVKLATEIEGLERHWADIDTELRKAKSIVRRMEREQAGLSEKEMQSLALQLRQAEERTDGTPQPVTPLDVDAAVEAALKGTSK